MMFWIVPACSLVTSGILYRAASGKELGPAMLVPVLLGMLFLWVGNYFPKLRRNRTLGIKVSWTLGNEENWNRTHRFAGKVWVCGGPFASYFRDVSSSDDGLGDGVRRGCAGTSSDRVFLRNFPAGPESRRCV